MPARTHRQRLQAIIPWIVAAAMLAWLFHIVPFDTLAHTVRRAPLGLFIALVVGYVLVTLAADSFATWITFRRSLPGVPVTWLETALMRGASYLLAVLHYGVGQGGLAWFLHRKHKVPLARSAGAVMIITGVNVILVAFTAAVGVALGGAPASPGLRILVLVLSCAFPAYLAVIAARPGFLRKRAVLAPLFDAGVVGHLAAAAARLPHIAVLLLGHILAMRLFGVKPPLGQALALLPIVFVVATLPIAPSGLGTAQAAAVALLSPFAAGTPEERQAAVLGYSLALQFLSLIGQALLGVACLRLATGGATIETPTPNDGL
jgi:uncharacterized membrane protein YbhN (UPF0104 family)